MKGYIYYHNGKVVLNAKEKPEEEDYIYRGFDEKSRLYHTKMYSEVLAEWEKGNIEVENAHESEHPVEGYKEITITKPVWQIVLSGQQVEHKGKRVTKIL